MRMHLVQKHQCKYINVLATEQFVQREEDAVALVGVCGEHAAEQLLLYSTNLPERFFGLKSGLAGVILQRLVNYHLKVVLVMQAEHFRGRIKELILEPNGG